VRTRSCRSATRRRGRTQGRGSAQRRTRAPSACSTRATRSAQSRRRALPLAAQQVELDLTACGRCGPRRVGRAWRGGAELSCWAVACGGGPPPRARTSCPGCTCASSCGATHDTEARACWGRRATGATPSVRGAPSSSRRWPLRRPLPLGRHAAARSRSARARARAVGIFAGGDNNTRMIPECRPRQKTVRMRPSDLLGLSPGEAKPSPRPTGDARLARSRRSGWRWLDTTPSRRAAGTTHDWHRIGTKPAPRASEWISGSRLARRGAQAGVAPPATGSCCRRSGGGPQNAELAFLRGWYEFALP